MSIKIKLNSNDEVVSAVRKALKENGGYCPCAIFKNEDTKCMCKEFRDKVAYGIKGKCHCGLYEYTGG